MVWVIGLRSHTIAGMVWVLNGMSHGMEYPWDVPWDGIFLGHPIGMLFLNYDCCSGAILKVIFGSRIAGCCSGSTFGSHIGSHIWEHIAGCCSEVTFGSRDDYNDD